MSDDRPIRQQKIPAWMQSGEYQLPDPPARQRPEQIQVPNPTPNPNPRKGPKAPRQQNIAEMPLRQPKKKLTTQQLSARIKQNPAARKKTKDMLFNHAKDYHTKKQLLQIIRNYNMEHAFRQYSKLNKEKLLTKMIGGSKPFFNYSINRRGGGRWNPTLRGGALVQET